MNFLVQYRKPRQVRCPNCRNDVYQKELDEHKKTCPNKIEHCKYYGCTATFVRKDVENHEHLEQLNHSKLMLRLPDDLYDIATGTNSELNDDAHTIVLSRMIVTLKCHLVLLLLLVMVILGTYCITSWGEHFYELFYSTKKAVKVRDIAIMSSM